jgi:hypothetical protein
LFATLAILQLGLALFESKTAHQSIDVYFHATYFVIAKFYPADFVGPRQPFLWANLFRCLPLVVAPSE